jgi:hypothetical protein
VLIDDFIGDRFRNSNVIVLGDLNDVITDTPAHNVFNVFLDNPGDYAFADMDIANGPPSGWSYPSWPSHIDHILVTNELFEAMSSTGSATKTIAPDAYMNNGWWEYDEKVSDHRPVGLRLIVDPVLDIQTSPKSAQDLFIAPNPLTNYATCRFPDENVSRTLKIVDEMGTVVREIEVGPDEHQTQLNLSMLPKGIYIVQLSSQSGISLWSKVIKY